MILQLLGIGALTGLLSGMLGVGGGFILVPLMVALGIDIKLAIGTSLAYIVVTAASGAWRHLKQGTVDVVLAASLVVVAAAFAQVGALTGDVLDGPILTLSFGVLLVGVAAWFYFGPDAESKGPSPCNMKGPLSFLCRQRTKEVHGETYTYYIDMRKAAVIGALVGFASGLLGVGGGFLMVPMVAMWMRIPMPVVVGSDLLGVLLTGMSGVLAHYRLGNIDFTILIPMIFGGVLAAQVGARLAFRLPQKHLKLIFNVVLLLAATNMLYNGIGDVFFGGTTPDLGNPGPGGG